MRFLQGTAVLAVCLAAACGGTDEILPDTTDAAIDAEEWVEPPPLPIDYRAAYQAIQVLEGIERRLPQMLVNGQLPIGTAAPTPSLTCCAAGGVTECVANPAAWEGVPLWEALGVRIESNHKFVLSASGADGTALRVTARLDTDCDGTLSDITSSCTLTSGVVSCTLELPVELE